jgi:hypothetical protein
MGGAGGGKNKAVLNFLNGDKGGGEVGDAGG